MSRKYYPEKYFTEEGKQFCEAHLESLMKVYTRTEEYPVNRMTTFGIPMFKFFTRVESKEELLGRIKTMMTMLGKEEVELSDGTTVQVE